MSICCKDCITLAICKQRFVRKVANRLQDDILDFDTDFCPLLKEYINKHGISKLIPIFNDASINVCVTRKYKLGGVSKHYIDPKKEVLRLDK